jgi:outer membrane protein assembly factor BamB
MAIAQNGGLTPDPAFAPQVQARVYAQPLFLEDGVQLGNAGYDALFVADEQNNVYAFNAATGGTLWTVNVGQYARVSQLCYGDVDPIGITGTPVLDLQRHAIYLDAMVSVGNAPHHMVDALDLDTGNTLWSLDLDGILPSFSATAQNQRAGLLIVGSTLYVPFGGNYGDCGSYHGRVVGIPLDNPVPSAGGVFEMATVGYAGAIWAPNGIASDGNSIFTVTGNGQLNPGTNKPVIPTWDAGLSEAVLRLPADTLQFSYQPNDYFVPNDWQSLDVADLDFSSSGLTMFQLPGAGSGQLIFAIGKTHDGWLLDRSALGGLHTPDQPLAKLASVATGDASGGMIAYTTPSGTYVGFNGACWTGKGALGVLQVIAGSPPSLKKAFCVDEGGANRQDQAGSPIVTTSDGTNDAVVWALGANAGVGTNPPSGGDNQLHAYDGDLGTPIVSSSGMSNISHWQAPIVAKGSMYVAGNKQIYAFRLK